MCTGSAATQHKAVSWVLECLEKLRIVGPHDEYAAGGRTKLHEQILQCAERCEKVTVVLPAFPFKSPNSVDKVLGVLPDRGEEVALQRLERFCCESEEQYPHGVEVVIFSDGRVFNDLLGVSAEQTQAYRASLIELTEAQGFTHIRFDSLEDYVPDSAHPIMDLMKRFNYADTDVTDSIKADKALTMLYVGFMSVVKKDLPHLMATQGLTSRRKKEKFAGGVAKEMMKRNMAFSDLVQVEYPNAVRFSIHAHSNAGPKYGVHLLPPKRVVSSSEDGSGSDDANADQVVRSLPATPWHHVVCENLDGTMETDSRGAVDLERYELVWKFGRPWCFRERTPLRAAEAALKKHVPVTLTEVHSDAVASSTGPGYTVLVVEAAAGSCPSVHDVPVATLRSLSTQYGTVVLRGFQQTPTTSDFEALGASLGDVLTWPQGNVLELKKVEGAKILAFTQEALPFHYDGMFKQKEGEARLGDVPAFQFFQCVQEYPTPEDPCNGRTLFTDTRRILASLTQAEGALLRSTVLTYRTPENAMFGHDVLPHVSPVVCPHPLTGEDVIRFAEPCGGTQPHILEIAADQGGSDAERAEKVSKVCDLLMSLVYDARFCYSHMWRKGDYVLADNHGQVHARTTLREVGREVRRVQFN